MAAEKHRDTPVVSGVYFLFKDGALEYVGQSKDCYGRIESHRKNGRSFDLATVMPLAAEFLSAVERALIKGYLPKRNVTHRDDPVRLVREPKDRKRRSVPITLPISEITERTYEAASGLGTISVAKARAMASAFGVRQAVLDEAIQSGVLRFVDSGRVSNKGRNPILVGLHSEVEAFCEAKRTERLVQLGLTPKDVEELDAEATSRIPFSRRALAPSLSGRN
jgi:hypothetical protein